MNQAQRIVLAAGLGLVASGGMFVYVNGMSRAEGAEPRVNVAIARCGLAPDSKLEPAMFAIEARPRRFVPPGAIASLEGLTGRVARSEIATGSPVLESQLLPAGQLSQAILPVPPGMRAITVAVDEVVGVAGFVQPGMIVDVVSTMDVRGKPTTKFLLQKIQVLACAQDATHKDDPSAKIVSSATLAVTPSQAEHLILAADRGKIRLAMRAPDEQSVAITTGVTPDSVMGISRPAPEREAPRHSERPVRIVTKTQVVRVLVPVRPQETPPAILVIRGTSTELVQR